MPLSPLAPSAPGCPRVPASPCGSCQTMILLYLKKTKLDIKPTATNNCELTLSPGGPLGPGGPSSPWRRWRREKGKQEDPIKCHICIWKTKPAISQAAHVFSRVKLIFLLGVIRRRYLRAGLPGKTVGSALSPGALCRYKISI